MKQQYRPKVGEFLILVFLLGLKAYADKLTIVPTEGVSDNGNCTSNKGTKQKGYTFGRDVVGEGENRNQDSDCQKDDNAQPKKAFALAHFDAIVVRKPRGQKLNEFGNGLPNFGNLKESIYIKLRRLFRRFGLAFIRFGHRLSLSPLQPKCKKTKARR